MKTAAKILVAGISTVALACGVGAGLASMAIYILMAAVLFFRPRGLFPAHG